MFFFISGASNISGGWCQQYTLLSGFWRVFAQWLVNFCCRKNLINSVKHVLSGHSKLDKTKVLKTNGSLIKVESIAECLEHSAILLTCI